MWELFLGYGSLTWLTCVVTVNVEKRLGFRIWLGSCSDTERKEAANACLNICIPFFIVIVAIWQIGSENAYVGKDGDKIVILWSLICFTILAIAGRLLTLLFNLPSWTTPAICFSQSIMTLIICFLLIVDKRVPSATFIPFVQTLEDFKVLCRCLVIHDFVNCILAIIFGDKIWFSHEIDSINADVPIVSSLRSISYSLTGLCNNFIALVTTKVSAVTLICTELVSILQPDLKSTYETSLWLMSMLFVQNTATGLFGLCLNFPNYVLSWTVKMIWLPQFMLLGAHISDAWKASSTIDTPGQEEVIKISKKALSIIFFMRYVFVTVLTDSLVWYIASKTDYLGTNSTVWFALMVMPLGSPALLLGLLAELRNENRETKQAVAKMLSIFLVLTPLICIPVLIAMQLTSLIERKQDSLAREEFCYMNLESVRKNELCVAEWKLQQCIDGLVSNFPTRDSFRALQQSIIDRRNS